MYRQHARVYTDRIALARDHMGVCVCLCVYVCLRVSMCVFGCVRARARV